MDIKSLAKNYVSGNYSLQVNSFQPCFRSFKWVKSRITIFSEKICWKQLMSLPLDVEIYSQECFRSFYRRYAILSDFFNIGVFIVCYVPIANY